MSKVDPVNIEILLRENIKKGIEGALEAVKELNKGVEKTTDTLKNQIAQQRQLIREITGDIKQLTLAAKEATDPGKKAEILGDLRGAKRALAEEQATLIGMQRQQIEGNAEEAASQGSLISNVGKWAVGLASLAGAMKVGKTIIDSTKESADQFGFAISAAENGLSYFWKTLATGDFSNFFTNMEKAIRMGYDYAEAMDAAKEAGWAQTIAESKMVKENAQLEIDLRDKTLSPTDRITAGNKRIANEEELAKGRIGVAKKEYEAAVLIATDRAKLDEKTLIDILSMANKTTKAAADNLNQLRDKFNTTYVPVGFSAEQYEDAFKNTPQFPKELYNEIKNAPKEVQVYADALKGYGGLKEDMIIGVIDTYKRLSDAGASSLKETKRVRSTLSSIKEELNKEQEDKAKKAKEDKELDNRIKATEELLKNANDTERDAIAKRLVLLEQEKKLIEWKNSAAKALAANKPIESKGGANVYQAIREMAKAGGIDLDSLRLKDTDLEISKLKRGNAERLKQAKALGYVENKNAQAEEKLYTDIADAAGILANAFSDSNRELSQMLGSVSQLAGGFADLKKGGVQGIMGTASAIYQIIRTAGGDMGSAERAAGLEKVNRLLVKQQELIDKAAREGGEDSARVKELEALQVKLDTLNTNRDEAQSRLDKIRSQWWNVSQLIFADRKTLKAEIEQDNKDIADTQAALDKAKQDLLDFNSYGITQNTLADSIAQAFQDGKGSVDDFGSYTNKILQEAVLNAFKANILGETLTNAQAQISEAFKDKTLTAEEIAGIRTTMADATKEAKDKWDALTSAFPDMFSADTTGNDSSLKGDITRMTEETGSALSGNISAIRINMARIIESGTTSMSMLQKSLEYQLRTADNTDSMNKTLNNIDSRLSRIELDGLKVK